MHNSHFTKSLDEVSRSGSETHFEVTHQHFYAWLSSEDIRICNINETIICNMHLFNELLKEFKINFSMPQYNYDQSMSNWSSTCLNQGEHPHHRASQYGTLEIKA